MAILKQNGVEGKILRAQQSGKVLKQNYNFGNYSTISNRNIWIEIPTLIGSNGSGWSFCMYSIGVSSAVKDRHPRFSIENSDRSSYINFSSQFRINDSSFKSSDWIQDFVDNGGNFYNANKKGFICFHQNSSQLNFVIDKLFLHKSTSGTGNGKSSLNYFTIFNRTIQSNEWIYMYNNLLGNDPLSSSGLICRLNFDIPIVVGSDIVIEDASGNGNHGVYKGLPAGTTTEKLEFVKNNLLEQW